MGIFYGMIENICLRRMFMLIVMRISKGKGFFYCVDLFEGEVL